MELFYRITVVLGGIAGGALDLITEDWARGFLCGTPYLWPLLAV